MGHFTATWEWTKELCGDQSSHNIALLESHIPHERHTDTDIYINSLLEQDPFTQQTHTLQCGLGEVLIL